MSDELLEPGDIYDQAIRRDVVSLRAQFLNETLENCYFWYLYHHRDCDAAKSSLAHKPLNSSPDITSNFTTKKSNTGNVNLGVFPAEIWQIISSHLAFDDLSSLRLVNSVIADIAAESMLKTVRFDLSFDSLERLRLIAGHKHLRRSVKNLTFEAGLLGTIGCVHHYAAHYEMEHHKDMKPRPPAPGQDTPQAQRLYARNLAKFNKELDVKYANYRQSFEAQERLVQGPKDVLFSCIDQFPNLQNITLATDQCRHLLSQRFIDRYGQDCAIPISVDPSQTPWQLQNILRPGIKRLDARQLSLRFFDGQSGRSKKWLQSVFRHLDHLSLWIRHDASSDGDEIASMLRNTNLSYAIGTATDLTRLLVNFSTVLPVGRLKDIIPHGKSFQQLRDLNLESFTTTENELLEMLKLQPSLKSLDLADVTLSSGTWLDLLRRMRDDLHLKFFTSGGVLSDVMVELNTDHYSLDAWQDGEMMSLGVAIDLYIIDSDLLKDIDEDEQEFELCWNPVNRVEQGDFMPYDALMDEYGPVDDSDLEDDELDDSDVDSDSDERSMHTANEAMSEDGNNHDHKEGHNDDNDLEHDSNDDLPDLEDVPPSPMSVD